MLIFCLAEAPQKSYLLPQPFFGKKAISEIGFSPFRVGSGRSILLRTIIVLWHPRWLMARWSLLNTHLRQPPNKMSVTGEPALSWRVKSSCPGVSITHFSLR
jgi:hypothetical protein